MFTITVTLATHGGINWPKGEPRLILLPFEVVFCNSNLLAIYMSFLPSFQGHYFFQQTAVSIVQMF